MSDSRPRFEALLGQALKQAAGKPLNGNKAIPIIPSTYREGFKFALQVVGLIEKSTTELTDKQFDIFVRRMDEILGNVAPPPDVP